MLHIRTRLYSPPFSTHTLCKSRLENHVTNQNTNQSKLQQSSCIVYHRIYKAFVIRKDKTDKPSYLKLSLAKTQVPWMGKQLLLH